MKFFIKPLLVGAAISVAAASAPVSAADISGAGATFPYPIYAKWDDTYKKDTGNGLNYQSIGSGGGIKQITARTVTFGATDKPLTEKELAAGGDLIQWPMVMGGIVPVVNTGIAHREPGVGMVGAGLVKPPIACFEQALWAFGS